jgi:hypothetical protein
MCIDETDYEGKPLNKLKLYGKHGFDNRVLEVKLGLPKADSRKLAKIKSYFKINRVKLVHIYNYD